MAKILSILTKTLEPDLRTDVQRRYEAMLRQLAYLREQKPEEFFFLASKEWPFAKLDVLCQLNSFYQVIVAPLASSAKNTEAAGFGRKIPILYGEIIRFDEERNIESKKLHRDFTVMVRSIGIHDSYLACAHVDEIIYKLIRFLKHE